MFVDETRAPGEGVQGLTPTTVMQLGFAFWGSKTLLTAVELGVFSELAAGSLGSEALGKRLGLHPRGSRDFLDALVAVGMLRHDGDHYANTPETDLFLDRAKPSYIGAILEVANTQFYPLWGSLTEALRTGQPQHHAQAGEEFFEALYQDRARLAQFMRSMTALSKGASEAIAQRFPWERYETFIDLGSAQGGLPVEVALAHDHISGGGLDRPAVGPIFEEHVAAFGLSNRLRFYPGDFFADPLPKADVLAMGHVLHGASLDQKRALLEKACRVLPDGGALIVFDAVIDDERQQNAFGLLMSLNMLIHSSGGFDYTGVDCQGWMRDAGFRHTYVEHLAGPDSMVVGIK